MSFTFPRAIVLGLLHRSGLFSKRCTVQVAVLRFSCQLYKKATCCTMLKLAYLTEGSIIWSPPGPFVNYVHAAGGLRG